MQDETNPADDDASRLALGDDDATVFVNRADPDATKLTDPDATKLTDPDATKPATPGANQPVAISTSADYLQDDTVAADLEIGTVLKDRFVIDKILGRGGMGVVYRALDLRKQEAHDRAPYVAIKSLSDAYQRDERMVMALQRESQKAQTLAHPNIATVYDFDRDGSLVYLTMEVLSGSPMDDFIDTHPEGLPPSRVAPIVRGMCLGLAYAHNKGIVHSDFKPGNVFLGNNDNPKVLDFGIARATPTTDATIQPSDVTQFDAGELGALTPSYAAKEMFFGADPHPADDVYAVAITIYQLLTGKHPFDSKPATQAEGEGLKPAPIAGLKRREWRAIRHGLAFNRADRQQHAADFLREYEGKSKLRLVVGVAVLLGVAFSGYFGFVQIQEQARIAPDIPFESLSGEVQADITELLNDGRMLESFNDLQALAEYRKAYETHPRNPEATAAIIAFMDKYSNIALTTQDNALRTSLLHNLENLMETDGFLGTHERLKAIRDELEGL